MGLLEDLKREADRARDAKQAEAARRAELDKIYRAEIAPRLTHIHRYLSEMLRHLEDANRPVAAAFDFPVLGKIEYLRQENYSLHIDGHGTPTKVNLHCECVLPEERKFKVAIDRAEELRQFLISQRIVFTEWPLRSGFGQIHSLLFQARLRVWAGLVFEADIEASRIRVASFNFEGLSARDYQFGYERIDHAWLDDLGHYLLREKAALGYLEMSVEARERLRRIAADEKEKGRLSRETVSEPQGQPVEPGLLKGLRNRWFKFGRDG